MAEPQCPYFRKCGGCSAQHIDYSTQVQNKREVLAKAIKYDNIKTFTGKEYNYRNRMDLIFHKGGLGFRQKGKWDQVVDIEQCAIADDKLNKIITEIRTFFKDPDYFDLRKHTGTFRFAIIRTPQKDSSISFTLNANSSRIAEAVERIKMFAEKTNVKNILVTYVPHNSDVAISEDYFVVKGKDILKEVYLDKEFSYSVQGFFQNNHEMAEEMQRYCRSLLETYDTKEYHLLDLYGGVGAFGIINSDLFKTTTIVESFPGCIDAAKENIEANNVQNTKAIVLDAKQLRKLDLPQPLIVITDPPRRGMHQKTVQQLRVLKPDVIIYVSCNVKQLEKEITNFVYYDIKSAAMFDLFPQTNHSEAVVELRRKKAKEDPRN
jgi:23S rRNA (uracil-5-)-methyltransferase RumA